MAISFAFAFCACSGQGKGEETERAEEIVVRDFETFDEIVHGVAVGEYFGSWDVNTDMQYVTSGTGSMKIHPVGNDRVSDVSDPFVRIAPDMSGEKFAFTKDFRKVSGISFDLYNAMSDERDINVLISYQTGSTEWGAPLTVEGKTQSFRLKANGWNNIRIKYEMTSLIDAYPIDSVHHIDIIFETIEEDDPVPEYYLDRFALTFSPYENYIDFDISPSVTDGTTVSLNSVVRSFEGGEVTANEVNYTVTQSGKRVQTAGGTFRATGKADYTIGATAWRGGKIIACNEFVLSTREKQHYGIIDDLNDLKDSSAILVKNRRGVIGYDSNAVRQDGTAGAVTFKQLREEAGLGFSYQSVWQYRDKLESFEVEMCYRTAAELESVPVFKGLFRDEANEYLMYKSEEGTWAHRYAVNQWVTVSVSVDELIKIMQDYDSLPDESMRPKSYPAVLIGFNSLITNDPDASIYFGNISVVLKNITGKERTDVSLKLPDLGVENFTCQVISVKNSAGAPLPFDSSALTFNGSAGRYTVEYLIKGDTILDTRYSLTMELEK